MSGGMWKKSVELFVPSTGQHCRLPDLPRRRSEHTMDGMMLCGGGGLSGTRLLCLTLTEDGWETTTTLLNNM